MTNKITDLENQPQQQHTNSIIKDLDELRTLSMEEMSSISGGVPEFPDNGGGGYFLEENIEVDSNDDLFLTGNHI